MSYSVRAVSLGLVLAVLCMGCGDNANSVSGNVTFEGQAVQDGRIDFLPADGNGQPASGAIVNGRYAINGVGPGPKIVQITAYPKAEPVRSVQELADAAEKGTPAAPNTALIPADAVGNNSTVEVTLGSQTFHFKLTKKTTGS